MHEFSIGMKFKRQKNPTPGDKLDSPTRGFLYWWYHEMDYQ